MVFFEKNKKRPPQYFLVITDVTQTCRSVSAYRPARDGIFVAADFNRRTAITNCPFVSERQHLALTVLSLRDKRKKEIGHGLSAD